MKKYLLKYTKDNEKNLKYDFLPSIIEIVEKPTNKWGTVIVIFSLFLFITVIIWSFFAKSEVVVSVPGVINSKDDLARVEAMTTGQVKCIMVEEGDYVQKGDVLLELDTKFVEEEIENLVYQLKILNVQNELYTKINEGENITNIDCEEYGELKWLAKSIVEEERLYRITSEEYRRLENVAVDVESARYEKKNFEQNRRTELVEMLSQCKLQIWQYERELETCRKNLEYYKICANADGYITNLQVLSKEEVVSAGEMVAYIVNKDNLIFECYVPDSQITDVKMGQKVQVKINAYPYNDYGMFLGEITDIADISVQNETLGNVYIVQVTIEEKQDTPFTLGMSGTAEIVTGQRRILEYFLEPIKRGIDDSFKEK